jgi:hypothetical protein
VKKIDLQDCLLALGIVAGETAAAVIWLPAALILAMLFCFGFAYLIEKSKTAVKLGKS